MKSTFFEKSSRHSAEIVIALALVISVSLVVFLNQTAAAGVFGLATNYPVGNSPGALATGDFNEDGELDIVVANMSDNNVSILLGNGSGGFAAPTLPIPPTHIVGGTSPAGIAVADFGNGHLDLAVTNSAGSSISILMGDGTGNFAPPVSAPFSYSVGMNPVGITAGNFNGDARADLAVADQGGGSVSILTGTLSGAGTFTASVTIPLGASSPTGIIAKDFDGDGMDDLAVTNMGGSSVSILMNDVSGVLTPRTPIPVISNASGIVSADFNSDGQLDIAVTNEVSNVISILLGDGTGNFLPPIMPIPPTVPVGNGPRALVAGDFGNGQIDLAVANTIDDTVTVLLGRGDGSFTPAIPATSAVGTFPFAITAGDFDTDGALDIATANFHSANISVLLDVPAITNVTSPSINTVYGPGAIIPIEVVFNRPVVVDTTGGIPALHLNNGTGNVAIYVSGSGTTTLTFNYTVAAPDTSPDLGYPGTGALALRGGTIKDISLTNAALALPAPISSSSLISNKNIVIDTTPPNLVELVPVPPSTTNHNPSYTFSSDEDGIAIAGGGCGSASVSATAGTIVLTFIDPMTFGVLPDGTYGACTITFTDNAGNVATLPVSGFSVVPPSGGGGGGDAGGGLGGGGGARHGARYPFLNELEAIPSPTSDFTPTYTFKSTESGLIAYDSACKSGEMFAIVGENKVTFNDLPDGTYDSCTIKVIDLLGRESTPLVISTFVVKTDRVVPTPPAPVKPATATPASGSSDDGAQDVPSTPVSAPAPVPSAPASREPAAPSRFNPVEVPATETPALPATSPAPAGDTALPVETSPLSTDVSSTPVQTGTTQVSWPTPPPTASVPASAPVIDPFASSDSATVIIPESSGCSAGTSTSFFGTVADFTKWGVCSVVKGVGNLFHK